MAEKKTKVLVLDDEAEISDFVKGVLEERNYDVFTAFTAEEAVAIARARRPKVALLDVKLGTAKDGFDALKELKEIDPGIRAIMVTVVDDADSIAKAKTLGADGYVHKPFNLEYLESFVLTKISDLARKKE